MSPTRFWHTSPSKFFMLCEVHADLNSPDDDKDKDSKRKKDKKPMYIDQVI